MNKINIGNAPAYTSPNSMTLLCTEKPDGSTNLNCTPFVRQYGILDNKWGDLLCQKENQTRDILQHLRKW